MPVKFENYSHSFLLNGKHVFAPSRLGRRIGEDVKQRVEGAYAFADYYYHLRKGGHVAGLHAHRRNAFFCKIDLENFFYSVARNRVVRSLKQIGVHRALHYGKWSCVKNPYLNPSYALPYGFVQSPILATLVLATSPVGKVLNGLSKEVTLAVYVDDISMSSDDPTLLQSKFDELAQAAQDAGFGLSTGKTILPSKTMSVFNCSLRQGETAVTPERIADFHRNGPSAESAAGFERYRLSVEIGNSR